MYNKRGQGLSTNAIILIVLGVVVLAVLIIGFTIGWDKIAPWLGEGNNIDTIVTQCNVACSTNSVYDYCSKQRELDDGTRKATTSCATFSVYSPYSQYGIQKCSSISCDFDCESIKIEGKTPVEKDSCTEEEDDITSIAKVEEAGNKCCIANK